jgi:hypothetical protein
VAFLHAGNISREVAQIMVASVKRAMPGARVVQMTDYSTKPILGVDEVIRKHWNGQRLMPYRFLHMKDFPLDRTIFMDYDVVVQKDLSALFEDDFDIALTTRPEEDLSKRPLMREAMPYNTGVMMSRPSGLPFWDQAYEMCLGMPDESQGWWGDQLAIKALAESTTLKLRKYPGDLYNYSPGLYDEDVSDKFVLHYKGKMRKAWMLKKWSELLPKKLRR